jgi:hypothetical protein
MKSSEWKTYRTRFLVKAKQLGSSLSFTDPLGRQHCGRRGDYLVESFDGVISIAPREIFEDIYVLMALGDDGSKQNAKGKNKSSEKMRPLNRMHIEALNIETIREQPAPPRFNVPLSPDSDGPNRGRRKSPQPVRTTSSRASHM